MGNINVKARERGELFRDVDPYIVRVRIKQREKGGRSLPDENDDITACVRVIRSEDVRPGVSAVRSQSRVSRYLERGR